MISSDEKDTLLAWIEKIEDKFIPNNYTPYRKYYVFSNDNSCPYLLWDIRNRIIQKENLEKCVGEPYIGDYIGWISEGGSIHHHMDPGCNGLDRKKLNHIRYNFFLVYLKKVDCLFTMEKLSTLKKVNIYFVNQVQSIIHVRK